MKQIEAKIVADSLDGRGNRLTTYILTYPRMIHAEVMTHRMFSRNAASSRAIPFDKMVKMVEEDPFIPIAWQKDHKGMQGSKYFGEDVSYWHIDKWLKARDYAIKQATLLNKDSVTKQLCNRLLEPFMWYTALVTTTSYDNFFELRCPKYQWQEGEVFKSWKDLVSDTFNKGASRDWVDGLEETSLIEKFKHSKSGAEIHIQALAEAMWDVKNESTPKQLKPGEWHIPFGDKIDAVNFVNNNVHTLFNNGKGILQNAQEVELKVATARCARLSYMTFDGAIDYEKDIALHDQLLASKHASPFEHVARCMTSDEFNQFVKGWREEDKGFDWLKKESLGWCNNLRGFIPYRYIIENNRHFIGHVQ